MNTFVAGFGRFQLAQLASVAAGLVAVPDAPDPLAGGWGIACCHGNRLEMLRANRPHRTDPEFSRFSATRTDMAAILLHDPAVRLGPRDVQPFLRRERNCHWAFFHLGSIRDPRPLNIGSRLPDGPSPSERYFLHILNALDPGEIPGSVAAAQARLPDEPALSFLMFSCETAIISVLDRGAGPSLHLGTTALLRILAREPLDEFEHMHWEALASGTTITFGRSRRELR